MASSQVPRKRQRVTDHKGRNVKADLRREEAELAPGEIMMAYDGFVTSFEKWREVHQSYAASKRHHREKVSALSALEDGYRFLRDEITRAQEDSDRSHIKKHAENVKTRIGILRAFMATHAEHKVAEPALRAVALGELNRIRRASFLPMSSKRLLTQASAILSGHAHSWDPMPLRTLLSMDIDNALAREGTSLESTQDPGFDSDLLQELTEDEKTYLNSSLLLINDYHPLKPGLEFGALGQMNDYDWDVYFEGVPHLDWVEAMRHLELIYTPDIVKAAVHQYI